MGNGTGTRKGAARNPSYDEWQCCRDQFNVYFGNEQTTWVSTDDDQINNVHMTTMPIETKIAPAEVPMSKKEKKEMEKTLKKQKEKEEKERKIQEKELKKQEKEMKKKKENSMRRQKWMLKN